MNTSDKVRLLYSWWVRTVTFFLPEIPMFQIFRGWLYSFAMKNCGKKFKVSANVILNRLEKLEVGDNVYFASGCFVAGGGDITIGKNVLFGPNVNIAAANHKFDGESFKGGYVFGEVIVNDNCWIGGNCSLLMGTNIPAASIVGAGSVCNKNYCMPFSLIAGVPARIIKDIRTNS